MLKPRKKITKSELKHDPLLDGVYKVRQFWTENKSQINRYGGGAIVALIILLVGLNWRNNQDEKAAAISGVATIDYAQDNHALVIASVSPVLDEFVGLPSFGPALYLLARSELVTADTANAENHFRAFLSDYSGDDLLEVGAHTALGVIADSRLDHATAAGHFQKASKAATTHYLIQTNLIHASRSYLRAGQPEMTIKLLERAIDSGDLDRRLVGSAQMLLSEAEVTLGRM